MVKLENKVELSGLIVLFIGVILLIFTFYSAYLFLTSELSIIPTDDFLSSFGEALAPLIEAIIHVLFLGIMGWIGSIVTIRAVQLLKQDKTQTVQQPAKAEPKQAAPQPVPAPPASSAKPVETKTGETKSAEAKPAAASDEAKK